MWTLFERDVYIRLSEDGTRLISTTRYGRLFRRTADFDVNGKQARETADEHSFAPLKKRLSSWASDEE